MVPNLWREGLELESRDESPNICRYFLIVVFCTAFFGKFEIALLSQPIVRNARTTNGLVHVFVFCRYNL